MISPEPVLNDQTQIDFFERHVARLLISLYYCGQPVQSLLEGEIRQVDVLSRLQQFDFWVREPGHLALALMRSFSSTPDRLDEAKPSLRSFFERMIENDQADIRRVTLPYTHNPLEDLDASLSWLTARALVSDRPSFAKSRQFSHQVVLETPGVAFVRKILESCPAFGWYRDQAEVVTAYFTRLEHFDLTVMSYLSPELNPAVAVTAPLVPFIRRRYETQFPPLDRPPAG